MAVFIQTDSGGTGVTGSFDPQQTVADLLVIANGDTSLHVGPVVQHRQLVTYINKTASPGTPPAILDYFCGTPIGFDALILPVTGDFLFGNGTPISNIGSASIAPNDPANPTNMTLIVYDTSDNNGIGRCVARHTWHTGLGHPPYDLHMPTSVLLFHEMYHAGLILYNQTDSHEEMNAVDQENKLRLQIGPEKGKKKARTRDYNDSTVNPGCKHPCCIVVSAASGSPTSAEVIELRELRDGILRRTEVGFDFFRSLFFEYYSFSPQVCTLMAREPPLKPLILDGFVRPLLSMLRTMEAYSLQGLDDESLGCFFLDQIERAGGQDKSEASVRMAGEFWRGKRQSTKVARELATLLRARAWPGAHVRWGLVEPVRIYGRLLEVAATTPAAGQLGGVIRAEIEQWAPAVPINPIWASLPSQELARELDAVEAILLQSRAARAKFRRRLRSRYSTVSSIRALPPLRQMRQEP